MFFIAAKVLGFFAQPSNFLILLGMFGALLMATRLARVGRRVLVASVLLLAVCGLSPLGNALILPLEQRFPAWHAGATPPTGLIVLGGMFDTVTSDGRGDIALTDAAERITVAAELARRYPQARLLFSGGSGRLVLTGANESDLAVRLFVGLGIERSRIEVDDRSRDTAENAAFSKAVASPKPGDRWVLITSAFHMPRSVGAFRRVGFAVEAYPTDWRTRGPADYARPFDNAAEGLRRTDIATREWIGLVTYWFAGRTSELFPGPSIGCDTVSAPSTACRESEAN
jgi:uncharacterized SAM-binding protein YcdF (DUF218 family)